MLENESWKAHLSERVAIIKKKNAMEAETSLHDYPAVYLPQLPQRARAPPCFQDHPSPPSSIPALAFLLPKETGCLTRKHLPLLLSDLPSPQDEDLILVFIFLG